MTFPGTGTAPTPDVIEHLYPVILCGGSGTRLWPLSRDTYPKQFLSLTSSRSLLQETACRTRKDLGLPPPVVLCGERHRFLISEQLGADEIVPEVILCEPAARNTGPALAVAAMYLRERDPDAILLALPSDHYIGDAAAFRDVVSRAVRPAEQGRLVCFGIRPTRPETGYGYIESGAPLNDSDGVFAIARFIEKPDAATAEKLVADGRHLWNSGMFVLPAAGFLDELGRYDPDTTSACNDAFAGCREEDGCVHLDRAAFESAPSISVDYAVMERTDRAAVVPADIEWNDIGSWRSLRDTGPHDADGNVLQGDVVVDGVRNSLIRSEKRLVAAIGVEDLVIVETDDAVLVGNASRTAEVGALARRLKAEGRIEADAHRRVFRPWGYYESLDMGGRFQVKHICVKPGGQLSLQMHHHRAEHWIVVDGTARIVRDDETRLLRENEWVFIPLGTTHRLENPGKLDVHLIEVQVGGYLGEDDIVRFEDRYGRS